MPKFVLEGKAVHDVLSERRVKFLFHANTATTACAFLKLGGLASRQRVEKEGLKQTSQYTDALDRMFGIWNDVFTDGVDIHERGGRVKGPNHYGPVLFKLPKEVLLDLPPGTEVMVAKRNPSKWNKGESQDERYFSDAEELAAGYKLGQFDQHVIFRCAGGLLRFPERRVAILLDDPTREVVKGESAYSSVHRKLRAAAHGGGIELNCARRECQPGCKCIEKYRVSNLAELF